MGRAACWALGLGSLAWAAAAQAQGITEGTRPMGMGGAFTANASGNGALYHNPAGVASLVQYSIEGSYTTVPELQAFNGSVVDSKLNTRLAAGAAYSYELHTGDSSKLSGHDIRGVLASQVLPRRLVLGLGGRYMTFKDGDEALFDGFTLDAGAILRLTEGFYMGVAGNNLLDVCADEDGCATSVAPRTLRGGLSFGSPIGLQLSADMWADLSDEEQARLRYAGGIELLLEQFLALRAGYRFLQQEKDHVISGGGGLKSEQVGLDVAYQYQLEAKESRFSLALQLYF